MFQTLSSDLGTDIQIFRDYGEAFAFVQVDIKQRRQLDELLEFMQSGHTCNAH